MRVGDRVSFTFAGTKEIGTVTRFDKSQKVERAWVLGDDGYNYPIDKSELKKEK